VQRICIYDESSALQNAKALPLARELIFLRSAPTMHLLYDSETYVVVHIESEPAPETQGHAREEHTLMRNGFEIVDKRAGKEVYLDGSWAELFQQHVSAWQENNPTEEEVEATLEQYVQLAHTPVILH
jgi:Protein of unknown function (DUF3567)